MRGHALGVWRLIGQSTSFSPAVRSAFLSFQFTAEQPTLVVLFKESIKPV